MLVKSSAHHLAPRRIRVNAVSPGWMWSRNIERRYGTRERADALAAEFQPLGRMADPEEVGARGRVPPVGPRLVRDRRRAARRRRLLDDRVPRRSASRSRRSGRSSSARQRQRARVRGRASSSVARLAARYAASRRPLGRRADRGDRLDPGPRAVDDRADRRRVFGRERRPVRRRPGRPVSCGRPCSSRSPSGSARGW